MPKIGSQDRVNFLIRISVFSRFGPFGLSIDLSFIFCCLPSLRVGLLDVQMLPLYTKEFDDNLIANGNKTNSKISVKKSIEWYDNFIDKFNPVFIRTEIGHDKNTKLCTRVCRYVLNNHYVDCHHE
jgi:hypothetical protein